MKNTEDKLWAAIRDIENGDAKTITEDPVNGLLPENKKLTKINVSHQSAKYNDGKPISRPTIDSYDDIVKYIKGDVQKNDNSKSIIDDLKEKNSSLKETIKYLTNLNQNLIEENRQLVEKNKAK